MFSLGRDQDEKKLLKQQLEEARAQLSGVKKQYNKLRSFHAALFEITEVANDCQNIGVFYKNVHRIISNLTDAKNFYVVLFDETLNTLEFVYHIDEKDVFPKGAIPYEDFDGSLTHVVIESGEPLLATPEIVDQLTARGKLSLIGASGVDWLGVPLLKDGFVVGVMAVQSYSETTRYTEEDQELLTFAAQHVVTAMLRMQDKELLQEAVEARTSELLAQIRERERSELLQESLFHISQLTNADIEITRFYDQVHNIIGQLLSATNFYIAKYDKENQEIEFVYFLDQYSKTIESDFKTRPVSRRLTEYVLRQGKTILLNREEMRQLREDGEIDNNVGDNYSWLGVPLISEGESIGVMVVQSYQSNTIFTSQDAELLNYVSQHVTSAIKRREAADYLKQSHKLLEQQVKIRTAELETEIQQRQQIQEQLKHAASHDALTGLPNRSVFIDLLNHAIARRRRKKDFKFAILFLDLDRFKVVNDSMGHHAGDLLLKIVSKELKCVVREMDTVARLGGDEFVILIEDLRADCEAIDIAERITQLLSSPITIQNQPVFIGTSIGLLYADDRYKTADVMLRDADTAMYYAKDKGKGRYEIFDSSMHKKVQDAIQLEADIRTGIENKEFFPYFQPLINLETNNLIGFEALARWNSSTRGFVYPSDFIHLAEETGLVCDIDLMILEMGVAQLKQWQVEFNRPDLYLSSNLFCTHFYKRDIITFIDRVLKKYDLAPECLRVELTERALIDNAHIVLRNLKMLKKVGIKILLDDFGTGYSSLSYLYRFPIDVLKIDRSFIQNMKEKEGNEAIVKTIIDLARNMGMETIGEGVEHLAEAETLKEMQCRFAQGYFYARPMAVEQVTEFIKKSESV